MFSSNNPGSSNITAVVPVALLTMYYFRMADLLPPELWYMVVGNIHCVFDRAQLSATCTLLHNLLSTLPQPGISFFNDI